MEIKVRYNMGMFDADSEDFAFGLIENMYKTESGIGYGCQVNDEAKREATEKLCFAIYAAVKTFHESTTNV